MCDNAHSYSKCNVIHQQCEYDWSLVEFLTKSSIFIILANFDTLDPSPPPYIKISIFFYFSYN